VGNLSTKALLRQALKIKTKWSRRFIPIIDRDECTKYPTADSNT